MNDARNRILQRLRDSQAPPAELPPVPPDREIFADFPEDGQEALCQAFAERLTALHGEVRRVQDEAAARDCLAELMAESTSVLVQPSPWLRRLIDADSRLTDHATWLPESGLDSTKMSDFDMGITTGDFFIARTGSIVCGASHGGGRRLSVLPPVHVVVAQASQVVPSLDVALARSREGSDDWSSTAIITGPSRTADIEKILVLGAHGPRRLVVVMVDNTAESAMETQP